MAGDAVDQDIDTPRGTTSILSWYDTTRPMFIDLVGDYAGKELFLVEGDSLLRECFEDERIDFDGGFQILHAVYVVERFLENLIKRHCFFHLAFFEDNAELSIPPKFGVSRRSRYLLTRSIIIRHLRLHLPTSCPNVEVLTFSSLASDEFTEYLHTTPVHFVMVHDGSGRTSKAIRELNGDDSKALAKTPQYANGKLVKTALRGMIWWFNNHKLNVALINRVEFQDSKVFTMIVESFSPPSRLKLAMTTKFLHEIEKTRNLLKEHRDTQSSDDTSALTKEDFTKLEEAFSDEDLVESDFLAAYAVSKLLDAEKCDIFMASAMIIHRVLLKFLPLSERRFPLVSFDANFEEKIEDFINEFSKIVRCAIDHPRWAAIMESEEVETDGIDIIDGRLFRIIIQAMCDGSIKQAVPAAARPDWVTISGVVAALTDEQLSLQGSTEPVSSTTSVMEGDSESKQENLAVLPFSNTVFDKHLKCIHVETDDSVGARLGAMKIYRETTHWHNYKKPLNPKLAPVEKVTKWRNPLRQNQFYMNEMTTYAASLTGAKGKALDAETITVGPKRLMKETEEKPISKTKKEEAPEASAKGGAAKKGTKKAAGGLSKKDQMIADNKERKGSSEADKAFNAWAMIMKSLEVISDPQDRYIKSIKYLNGLDSAKAVYLEGEIYTFVLQSLLTWWASYCKDNKKAEGYHVVALIWTTIRSICVSKSPISKDTILHMTKVCQLLGITDAMHGFKPSSPSDRKLSFTFKYPMETKALKIEFSQSEFQLNYCGPYMDRMLDAKPDPRISSFIPDGWQRDVLDQLDANNSVFVVAPTSAGKTFISFYAMEQVLRADNDGVIVYVAPTKALVNQIAAEIQGRFSKKFPLPGKGVWAIHTRDYRINNSTGCQILVTVPHILQIMLLSPSNAKSWAPRVRRIIFDEIHSIGQAEDGVVWEQLLLLAPCPIVALSATVGNPEQFNEWLAETQKAMGAKIKMIQHHTRYSDLRKYMYQPPGTFKFTGFGKSYGVGLGLDGLTGFETFHPALSLVDKSRGIPDDLAFEPRDCFTLWKAMVKCQTGVFKVPDSLDPANALPPCIRKMDIFSWEKSIKKLLVQWMKDGESPFDKVMQELTPETGKMSETAMDALQQIPTSSNSSLTNSDAVDATDLITTTMPLLFQLHQRRALPAILFNYDRSKCEQIGFELNAQLVDAESKWKEGPVWRKLMEGYEKYKEQKDKKSRKLAKPAKKAKGDEDEDGGSKLDRMRDESSSSDGSSIYDSFDPEAPQPDFSFANPKILQKSELDEYVYQLRRKHIREELIDLFNRGIGIHHAGMNRKYRQCIEMLFRKGFLRVIIATGTLALGINMPCATVVFSGDSVFLTALNFRQAAGRSGRRGFDLLGNVVFQGISKERASRLLSSKLPEITGHFPITTTLVLRLFTLLNDSKQAPYAVKAINSLLSQPRLYMGGKSFKEQVLHHLRFSIEYLRRNELLGPRGEPINFTSCVSHLYYTENSSFAFHALLRGGYFHNLCADIETRTSAVLYDMILVLAHIFGRRVCRNVDDPEEIERINLSPSIVYLPSMPEEATKILRTHNKNTLDIFTTYAKTFAAQHTTEAENVLPLTKVAVGPAAAAGNGDLANGNNTVLPSLPNPKARSAFVALSGLGDDFKSIEDLCSSSRDDVFLESAVIPHLEIHPDETQTPLNAYLLDFYMHGALEPLEKANGIRKSDVWFVLNDFSMVLATIVTSLAVYLGLGNNADPEMLDVMGTGDLAENDADADIAEEIITDTSTVKTPVAAQAGPVKKSKKVADDWEAGEDALVAEEDYRKTEDANATSASDPEEYEKLMTVYVSFRKLQSEFNSKFLAIWA